MIGPTNAVQVLATAEMDGEAHPLLWTREQGPGRLFTSIPGHYQWTLDDPLWRLLLIRAIAWCGHRPVDSLIPTVTWSP